MSGGETELERRLKRLEEAMKKLKERVLRLEIEAARLKQSVTAGAAR